MGIFDDVLDDTKAPDPPQVDRGGRGPNAPTTRLVVPTGKAKESKSIFDDVADDIKSPPAPANKPADAPASFTRRFEAVGPVETTNSLQRLDINNQNEGDAAGQLTTPNIAAHQKNYLSSRVYENDAGQLLYEDLDSGDLIPTDKNKHVVLRDPADNRLKVYARDDNTNESRATAAGRLIRLGAMSQAPSAAVSDAAAGSHLLTMPPRSAPVIAPGQQVANAAERIGVDVPRAVTSDNASTQWAGKIVSNIPFAGTPLRQASETAINQLGQAATNTERGFGSGSIPQAGAEVRSGIERYVGPTTQARQNLLYGKVDKIVDNSKTTDLANTRQAAQTILDRRNNAAITQPSEAVKKIEDAVTRPGGLNYEGTKTLRTYIGEMMEGRSPLPADVSQAELKQIYKGLSTDLRTAAQNAGGGRAVEAFDRANKYTRLVSDRRENLMRILGAKSDEGIFDKVVATAGTNSRADIKILRQARQAVGSESWDELSSGVISRLGRDPSGNFSPDRFTTAFGKLTPDAKTVLFRTTGKPQLANALDDIAKVSERFKELNKFANPSGSGQTVAGAAELSAAYHAVMQGIQQQSIIPPLTFIGGITSGRVLSHLLSVPKTAEATARWSRAYELAITKPSTMTIESFKQASKMLASNIGSATSRVDLVPELTSRLQDMEHARAKENKKKAI